MQEKHHRLLVIEYNAEWRDHIVECLQDTYEVIEAADGQDGWEKVLSLHPDLIITDVKLPQIDGIKLSGKIKTDKRTRHLPVILLTALSSHDDQLRGLSSGANDYLTKPFNFDILLIKIKNLLAVHNLLKKTYSRHFTVLPAAVEVNQESFMSGVTRFMEENITSGNLNVASLSAYLGTSRVSLYNRVLELTGKSPIQLITSFKLDKAAGQLTNTNKAPAQVARETGFATPHYFSKIFKDKFGLLPSEYRHAHQKL
ncbi:response regulator [Mucilaginibacter psychrotolerans]|uniref:Response regulator transcription factor n=1 Tax=Mucilaginibacter psychrotolerans TaxID=1524096 RepID=A0A4Y8SGJ6_9SPHI|nr:response regulator [Mucilaginibacter psychrotolerans]TFF37536.1 response regulator transcription factor [Mucilaginibacter psychrotolerans]